MLPEPAWPQPVAVDNWARFPHSRSVVILVESQQQEIPFAHPEVSFLPFGMGRSLGDCCLNDGNALLATRGLRRVMAFDRATGVLRAEAGITFDEILRLGLPQGWFLPVTPGTRFVSLGGAIANDVHGKNHHVAGTFGCHVTRLGLRRSDGGRMQCSREQNAEWFRATVGGLGLTGLIEWAEIRLKPVVNSWIDSDTIRYGNVNEFHALSSESAKSHEYAAAWTDTLSLRSPGRGVFIRGNHNHDAGLKQRDPPGAPLITIPFVPPFSLLNRWTLQAFNTVFYWARPRSHHARVPAGPFFYPLDGIGAYHRMYGPGGMIQWQALITSKAAAAAVLHESRKVGGSFLTVMKVMGDAPRQGLLSFSGAGVTIALDFPYSRDVLQRLSRLDEIVVEDGGRLYPAKDARMPGRIFRQSYPQWEELLPFIDPKFSSSFWRRVMAR